MIRTRWIVPVLSTLVVAVTGTPVAAQPALLDVPYVSQPPELCGGAALTMVLRYWGVDNVVPQDFATLIESETRGIVTTALAAEVRRRGWIAITQTAETISGLDELAAEIARGRPVVALLHVDAEKFHYVVVIAVTDQVVIAHDPARGAFRVMARQAFDRVWAPASRWSLVVLPGNRTSRPIDPAPQPPGTSAPVADAPCASLVERSVGFAQRGDAVSAEAGLNAAMELCPKSSGPWREMSGLRFQQSRWNEARDLASAAVARDDRDEDAWQLLGASRYLAGDPAGALDAWNRADTPHADLIAVHGTIRTAMPVVTRLVAIEPRNLVTTEAIALANRRVNEVPGFAAARVRYDPLGGGRVDIVVDVVERDVVPHGWLAWTAVGIRPLVGDEAQFDINNALGAGDALSFQGRWSAPRPLVGGDFSLPAPAPLAGVLSLTASDERQTYANGNGAPAVEQARRYAGLRWANWATSSLRWQVGAYLDRIDGHDFLAVEAGIDRRFEGDRLSIRALGGVWPSASASIWTTDWSASWRSTTRALAGWTATAGWSFASAGAPLALWNGAGTGTARLVLLRAHPLLHDDVLTGPAFGRELAHASGEYLWRFVEMPIGGVALAGFVDSARAGEREGGGASPLYVDAGIGLRINVTSWGAGIRLDVAHGLRDKSAAVSTGWLMTWPSYPPRRMP